MPVLVGSGAYWNMYRFKGLAHPLFVCSRFLFVQA